MNIAIVNAWSDDNKGDAAIVEGLVGLLADGSERPPLFSLMSVFRQSQSLMSHYRHTQRSKESIRVFPALLPVDPSPGAGRASRLLEFGRAGLLLLLGQRGAWLYGGKERDSIRALCEADLVISKGGHVIFSRGTWSSVPGMFRNLFPILLAQRFGRPTAVVGQSIGPVIGSFPRYMARRTLANLAALFVREPISQAFVKQLDDTIRVQVCWDTAFAMTEEPLPACLDSSLPDRFVALTARQWGFPYKELDGQMLYDRYLDALADCVRYLNEECGLAVVVVPQVIGPTPLENDLVAARQLRKKIARVGETGSNVVWVDADLTAGQLMDLYGRADFVLATRFHSAILAMAAATPALVVSYHGPKAEGIMQMLGLSEYVVSMSEVGRERLRGLCEDILGNRERIVSILEDRRLEIRSALALTAKQILALGRR